MQSDAFRCEVPGQRWLGDAVPVPGASQDPWEMVNPSGELEMWWGHVASHWAASS